VKLTHCPVPWCESIHDDGDSSTHHGIAEGFPVRMDPLYTGLNRDEDLHVGLDQPKPDDDVMVSLSGSFGEMWLSRDEAKRLAIRLVQLDLNANGVDGA